jgi:hypothetical protein
MKVKHVGEMLVLHSGPDGSPLWMHGVFLEATAEELEHLRPHFEVLAGRPVEIQVDKAAELEALLAEETEGV